MARRRFQSGSLGSQYDYGGLLNAASLGSGGSTTPYGSWTTISTNVEQGAGGGSSSGGGGDRRFQTGSLGSQYNPPSLPGVEQTQTGQNIEAAAAATGIPAAVLYSMYQQTNYALAGDDLAYLSELYNQGYDITQIDPRTGNFTAEPQAGSGGGGQASLPVLPPSSGGGEDGYKMFKWTEGGYDAVGGNVPSWWQAFVPEEVTPETAYGAMLNAMIPYLSPQDQVRVAHSLYGMFDTELSRYKPGYIPEIQALTEEQARYLAREGRPPRDLWPGGRVRDLATGETITERAIEQAPLDDQSRRYFQSAQRASDAIATLSNMREAMVQGNRWKLGPGYKWLQNILGSIGGEGAAGTTGQTRLEYQNMLSAVDPFLSQAGSGALQAFGPLGKMLARPFYASGSVMPYSDGRYGTPNRRFF